MKKMLSMLMAIMMLFALASCGSTGSAEEPAETAPAAEETTEETEAPTAEEPAEEDKAPAEETPAEEEAAPAEQETAEDKQEDTEDDEFTATKAIIEEYGFFGEYDYSDLDFTITGDAVDCGDYYEVPVSMGKAIQMPNGTEVGDEVTVTVNEQTGETLTLTCTGEGTFACGDEDDYYTIANDEGEAFLYYCSDDRVDCTFADGVLRVNKDASCGVAIMDEYHTVTAEDLTADEWYNGVAFDENGYVTDLVFIGD